MTATEYWKQRFGEKPQNDNEKLAVAMMSDYRNYCLAEYQKEVLAVPKKSESPLCYDRQKK